MIAQAICELFAGIRHRKGFDQRHRFDRMRIGKPLRLGDGDEYVAPPERLWADSDFGM